MRNKGDVTSASLAYIQVYHLGQGSLHYVFLRSLFGFQLVTVLLFTRVQCEH